MIATLFLYAVYLMKGCKHRLVLAAGIILANLCHAQWTIDSIDEKSIGQTLRYLSSDEMMGRGNQSKQILEAAEHLGTRFKKAGLKPLPGQPNFFISFNLLSSVPNTAPDILEWNGEVLVPAQFIYRPSRPGNYNPKDLSGFKIIKLDTCFNEGSLLEILEKEKEPLLIWSPVLQPGGKEFLPPILRMPASGFDYDILLVTAISAPQSITLSPVPGYYRRLGYNVVGILPGKTRPGEVVLFSAHYDHIGVDNLNAQDTILNGANDNASGVTTLVALAEYFAKRNDNERTLFFCAFAGEEWGLLGSKDFVDYIVPEHIVAGLNFEMLGVPEFGKGRVFFTGSKYSNLQKLMSKRMAEKKVKVIAEQGIQTEHFKRSDNYMFAVKGIPAHTISSSTDEEPCYHKACDEFKRMQVKHLTDVIRAIAFAVQPLINGEETPSRIPKSAFRD